MSHLQESRTFVRDATGLVRSLSPFDSMAINISVITVGCMFYCLAFVGASFGTNIAIGFVLAAALSLPFVLLYSTFSAAMPNTGGDYVWVSRVLHPSLGFTINLYITLIVLSWPAINASAIMPAFISTGLIGTSIITGNSAYASLASTLNQQWVIFLITALPLVLLLGTRKSIRFIWVGFLAGGLAVLIIIATFLSAGHSAFVSNFNAVSSVKYDAVLTSATGNGFLLPITLVGTFVASVFALINTLGYNFNSYYVGEIKQANSMKTQLIASLGSLLIFAVLGYLLYFSLYYFVGTDFVNSVLFLFNNVPSRYPLPFVMPVASAYLAYATNIAFLPLLVNVLLAISYSISNCAFAFVAVRNFFAWSFDRVLPAKLASVDTRGSPWFAVLVATGIAEMWAVVELFTPISAMLAYDVTGFAIAWAIVSVTAIIFPYVRKEMFQSIPESLRGKMFGTYKVTLVGIIGLFAAVLMVYASLWPTYIGALNPVYFMTMLGPFLIGIPLFFAAKYIRGRQGIFLNLAYRVIPPE